jgi:serine phosphatase RsbU (regulator of sigma subunit)
LKKIDQIVSGFHTSLENIQDLKQKVIAIIDFSIYYGDTAAEKIIPILETGVEISRKIGFNGGEAICIANLSFINLLTQGHAANTWTNLNPAAMEALLEKVKGDEYYSFALNLVAYYYWFKGEYDKGFDYIFKAIKSVSEGSNPIHNAWNHYALGVFYFDTKDIDNSGVYYRKAYEGFAGVNYEFGMARSSNGLATIDILKQDVQSAFPKIEYSIGVYRELGNYSGLSRGLNDLGLIEKSNKNYEKAIALLSECIDVRKEISHYQGLITSYTERGETFLWMQDYGKALEDLETGLEWAKKVKATQKEIRLHKLLSEAYKKVANVNQALSHFEEFYNLNSKLLSDESTNNIKKIQSRFEKEQSEKEAEIERLKNVELKKAYELIEEQNKDIRDSINYAKRIQLGILPTEDELKKCFENYFVLYIPKDIVSGDFYWAVNATSQKLGVNFSLVAAVDCTGHGIPGAFMSMLGNTLLNQTIFNPEIIYPSDVLNFLNRELPQNLKSTGTEVNIRDGMDMSLCSFNWKELKMVYAGANNPCWIIRGKELIELRPDKQAISASTDMEKKSYTDKEFNLKKGDSVYLFTDGLADQFGGPKGKKFKYKQLKEILLSVQALPVDEQKQILSDAFYSWKGELDQIDDVLVIGIKV